MFSSVAMLSSVPPPNPVHYLFKFFVNWVESKYICLRRRGAGVGGGETTLNDFSI